MAALRLLMRNVLEILRLRFDMGVSERAIARSVGKSRSTVGEYLVRFKATGLSWPLPASITEEALERRLFPEHTSPSVKVAPDFAQMDVELRRKGVTLQLLWLEYAREHGTLAYQYSRFCELYQARTKRLRLSMRQVHLGGEKMFVDFSGDGMSLADPATGERKRVALFVAVLGASSMTYARATLDETLGSWVEGMTCALEAFGGVPGMVVPDNPRALVTRVDRHEPDLNPTVQDWAAHYGTCVMPARPYKPKDKAKVEVAVLVVQRWVVAVLRNQTFHTLTQLNHAIAQQVGRLNTRLMKGHGTSRASLFSELDAPALKPLPVNRFQMATWHPARVHPDYHVQVEKHFYSVPYVHRGQAVMVRVKATCVEVLLKGVCVATHSRSKVAFGYTTLAEHMPSGHKAMVVNSSVEEMLRRAALVGPSVHALCVAMTQKRSHPEQAIKGMQGVLALKRTFPEQRVEAACARALSFKTISAKAVRSILKDGLDTLPATPTTTTTMPAHQNIRGGSYFLH